ncbi:MAG TPA: ankyrin repeat domain-containing protein, partial [Candidatus Dependentiae bacterium]|nr:ankyrin repeat domain-containing protein [Candidatus Dependentiae bacterium]
MLYRNKLLFICLSLLSFISVQAMEITTLHEAINQGNLERVVQLLNNGHRNRINELCQDGTFKGLSPLHIAASKGQLPIIAALIAENANPNLFDQETGVRDHKTPLHIAIEKGNPTIVRYLLEHTANLEIPTKRGTSAIIFNVYPIHQAAQIGSVEIVRYMLDKHASVMHKDSTDNYPLHYAVRHNNVELVKALIDVPNETFYQTSGTYGFFVVSPTYWKGISKKIQNRINYINSRNSVGLSPLDIASYEGNVDVVRYLIDNQATSLDTALTHAIKGFDIRTQENEETRYEKTKAIICALIKAGAHISENPNILKLAILHGATEKLVRLLLSLGASTGIIHPGENYWIDHPLHEAADAGNLDRVRTLLHAPGFHANLRDITQETPLHKAAAQGHTQIIEYLINEGAIIDIQNATGKTPLHIAASKGFIAAAQALLKHGANIRQETPEHITPLIIAIQNNQTEMAKFLINHGACIYQKNPIHKAIETGNVTLINKILEKHAIITPHMIELARNSHPEIAQLLRERLSTMEHTFKLHQLPSLQEDEMVHNRAEGECWQLIPSLQQARPDGKLTQMCGYYALYNAVCFTRSREADMLHRATFSQFLNEALKDIYALRSFNPLDNLTTQDLQYIIQMHYENLPIIVIEKKSLFIYLNKIVADINQALEVTPNKNFLRDFIEKKINKLSIIAGTGDSSGHWFTLYAERRQDDKIILKISDSAYKIANWNLKRFEHDVLPFYLAISNPLESWP